MKSKRALMLSVLCPGLVRCGGMSSREIAHGYAALQVQDAPFGSGVSQSNVPSRSGNDVPAGGRCLAPAGDRSEDWRPVHLRGDGGTILTGDNVTPELANNGSGTLGTGVLFENITVENLCRDSYNSTAHLNVDNDTGGMNRQQQRSDPVGVAMRFNTGRARYLELRDPCTGNKGTDKWPRAAVTECVPTAWGLAASPLVRLTPSLLEKAKNRSERRDILLACRKETRRTVMEKIVVCAAG